MSLIQVNRLVKEFGVHRALDGISVEFEEGGQYVIEGASGSGKSTLLYLMGGLDRPSSGEVIVDGQNLSNLSDEKLALYRNNFVGFIFQFHFLLPTMTGLENILLPAKIGGKKEKIVKKRSIELAESLGITHTLAKFPYELSGGEQQRLNIVRALSLNPKLLLCDEPTGSLDSENSQIVMKILKDLSDEFGTTLIIVTHDRSIAERFSCRVSMKDGKFL